MADYLALVQQLQREVGVAGATITTVSNQTGIYNKLVNWIKDADEYIQSLHIDWQFLWREYSISTSIGNAEPASPSDLNFWDRDKFFLDYTTSNHKHLVFIPYDFWRKGRGRGELNDRRPDSITIKPNDQIVLIDPPDDVYSLTGEYWATPTLLVNNTDVSIIPVAFHRIILAQAKLWYSEEQEMPEVYQIASRELNGDGRKQLGLLGRLESLQLPEQAGRTMGVANDITVIPS